MLSYDWCDDDSDPSPSSWNGHGTAVAGVAAAVGNNGLDVTGVAFNATIAGSTLIACWAGDATEANALSYESDDIDIYTNSWGPADDGQTLEAPGPLTLAAFESDAYNGR
ncbi:MAG TPA: furin, partial [Candidatus Poseidoniales archaeon]|nr:furin [Candidatus Poseidoniales archaeon]